MPAQCYLENYRVELREVGFREIFQPRLNNMNLRMIIRLGVEIETSPLTIKKKRHFSIESEISGLPKYHSVLVPASWQNVQ